MKSKSLHKISLFIYACPLLLAGLRLGMRFLSGGDRRHLVPLGILDLIVFSPLALFGLVLFSYAEKRIQDKKRSITVAFVLTACVMTGVLAANIATAFEATDARFFRVVVSLSAAGYLIGYVIQGCILLQKKH